MPFENCRTSTRDDFPTHKPLMVDIRTTKLKQTMEKSQPTTNFAKLIEDVTQEKIDEARSQTADEDQEPRARTKVDEAKQTNDS